MEKDIGKIPKTDDTNIVVRIDDFGGRRGLTIREFVSNDRYTGFTKSGVRIPAEHFLKFREMINSISLDEITAPAEPSEKSTSPKPQTKLSPQKKPFKSGEELPDY